jgi:hypothetical protein
MPSETLADLRTMMFEQYRKIRTALAEGKPLDRHAERLQYDISLGIIETAKVEVMLAAVMKGSLEVPFIEAQTTERNASKDPQLPAPAVTPMERAAQVLTAGPPANHAWRNSGDRRQR